MHTRLQLQICLKGCVPHPSLILKRSQIYRASLSQLSVGMGLLLLTENKCIDILVCIDLGPMLLWACIFLAFNKKTLWVVT